MRVFVYVALALPLLAALTARWLAARLEPRTATWLLTGSALVLGAAAGAALTVLAVSVLWLVPPIASLGDWPIRAMRHYDPTPLRVALPACVLLAAALGSAVIAVIRRARALAAAACATRSLPGGSRLAVVDDPVPAAYAVPGSPGHPGRIVLTAGMLDALDDGERRVVLAHEHAHAAGHHFVFVALSQLAAATNPLLRPVADAVRFCVERWADEQAARQTGDRRLVARTIGKAALLARGHESKSAILAVAGNALRGTGPVPRRVAALLAAPPRQHPLLLAAASAVLLVAGLAMAKTAGDLHMLLELA